MRYVISFGKVLLLLGEGLILAVYPVFLVLFTDKHSQSDYAVGLILVGVACLATPLVDTSGHSGPCGVLRERDTTDSVPPH